MKNLINIRLLFVACISLLSFVSCAAQMESASSKFEQTTTQLTKSAGDNKESPEMIKCADDDKNCFISAAKTCQPATLTNNETADFGAASFSKTDYFEIRGSDKDKCRLYLKVLSWKTTMNEEQKAAAKERENGKTPEEIARMKEMQDLSDKQMKDVEGTDGVCAFTTAKLVVLFERWKKGQFSSNDYKGANCKGTYFTEANGFPKGF